MLICPNNAISRDGEIVDGVAGMTVHKALCDNCFLCVDACCCRAMRNRGRKYSASDLIDSVKLDMLFFQNSGGGVTVTGGEPLLQPEFTYAFLYGCKELGMHTMIETCGHGKYDDLSKIAEVCSGLYFDVKMLDAEKHSKWTGVSNTLILENLGRLCKSIDAAKKIIVRVPCIPNVNDNPEDIQEIALFVKSLGISSIQLMPYNTMAEEKYRWVGEEYFCAGLEARDKGFYANLNRIIETTGMHAIYG